MDRAVSETRLLILCWVVAIAAGFFDQFGHEHHGLPKRHDKGISRARQRRTMMIDERLARMQTHRSNIYRYRHLVADAYRI
jgi:hypothetical protein